MTRERRPRRSQSSCAARASRPEYLVVLRSPEKLGYWHLVAGGVEWGEEPAAAAARELREETGLEAEPRSLGRPARVRPRRRPRVRARAVPARHGADRRLAVRRRRAGRLGARARRGARRVPLARADEAVELLHYPEPRDAVRLAAERS